MLVRFKGDRRPGVTLVRGDVCSVRFDGFGAEVRSGSEIQEPGSGARRRVAPPVGDAKNPAPSWRGRGSGTCSDVVLLGRRRRQFFGGTGLPPGSTAGGGKRSLRICSARMAA
jgi:hypothetical protein